MLSEKLLDFPVCIDGKGGCASGFSEPSGPVNDVSADGSRPELDRLKVVLRCFSEIDIWNSRLKLCESTTAESR